MKITSQTEIDIILSKEQEAVGKKIKVFKTINEEEYETFIKEVTLRPLEYDANKRWITFYTNKLSGAECLYKIIDFYDKTPLENLDLRVAYLAEPNDDKYNIKPMSALLRNSFEYITD